MTACVRCNLNGFLCTTSEHLRPVISGDLLRHKPVQNLGVTACQGIAQDAHVQSHKSLAK